MSQVGARRLEPAAIAGVMSREVANFRTYWKATTFSSVLEPIVYRLAFGLGLGATLVDRVDGLEYVQFVATGMVATAGRRPRAPRGRRARARGRSAARRRPPGRRP